MPGSLIIFIRNPQKGKVKTRLAKELGEEKALDIYLKLLRHTHDVTRPLAQNKYLYYSDFIDNADMWSAAEYQKRLQAGPCLGSRMQRAFEETLAERGGKAIIVGSDCLELTTDMLENAFKALDAADTVIGPAHDGGYYLLGMKKVYPQLFADKIWGSTSVYKDTVADMKTMGLKTVSLEVLRDIDTAADLARTQIAI